MSDLVQKLRDTFKQRRYGNENSYHPDFDLFDVAADEIESLRAQLASLRQVAGAVSLESGLTFDAIKSVMSARLPHDQ